MFARITLASLLALASTTIGCAAEGVSVDEDGYVEEGGQADDDFEGENANTPFCQSQTIDMEHVAKNHVFGEGNLTGYTRKKGSGDKILTKFAAANTLDGWHGAWDSRKAAETAIRDVMKKGCAQLTAWAKDAPIGGRLTITKSTSQKGLSCSRFGECLNTSAAKIVWLKVDEEFVTTSTGARTKIVYLKVITGYPVVVGR